MTTIKWSEAASTLAAIAAFAISITLIWQLWPGTATNKSIVSLPQATLTIADVNLLGSRDAPVAMIEFSDFQCPFCARFSSDVQPQVIERYVTPGKVSLAFRHFPLSSIHAFAVAGAAGAECAAAQGRFWEMHDTLFRSPVGPDGWPLLAFASTLQLDVSRFQRCLGGDGGQRVDRDIAIANTLGVVGTPTFFIGRATPDGRVTNIKRLMGAQAADTIFVVIDALLRDAR